MTWLARQRPSRGRGVDGHHRQALIVVVNSHPIGRCGAADTVLGGRRTPAFGTSLWRASRRGTAVGPCDRSGLEQQASKYPNLSLGHRHVRNARRAPESIGAAGCERRRLAVDPTLGLTGADHHDRDLAGDAVGRTFRRAMRRQSEPVPSRSWAGWTRPVRACQPRSHFCCVSWPSAQRRMWPRTTSRWSSRRLTSLRPQSRLVQ